MSKLDVQALYAYQDMDILPSAFILTLSSLIFLRWLGSSVIHCEPVHRLAVMSPSLVLVIILIELDDLLWASTPVLVFWWLLGEVNLKETVWCWSELFVILSWNDIAIDCCPNADLIPPRPSARVAIPKVVMNMMSIVKLFLVMSLCISFLYLYSSWKTIKRERIYMV